MKSDCQILNLMNTIKTTVFKRIISQILMRMNASEYSFDVRKTSLSENLEIISVSEFLNDVHMQPAVNVCFSLCVLRSVSHHCRCSCSECLFCSWT